MLNSPVSKRAKVFDEFVLFWGPELFLAPLFFGSAPFDGLN